MIDQEVARDRGYPRHERAALDIIGLQRAVHLDENLLGEVLGIVCRSGEAVTDVVDPPVVTLHDLLPGGGVAGDAATDQHSNHLGVFQDRTPRNSWVSTRLPGGTPPPKPHTTTLVRYCGPKSSRSFFRNKAF